MTGNVTRADFSSSARGGGLAQALTRAKRTEPRAYDFRRPTKLSREHVRVLQICQEAFARQATTLLTSLLRTGARLDLESIDQFAYDEYIATLDNPTFIAPFSIEPLPGKGLISFPLASAMACVDHMLGGPGTGEQPSRAMTGMETLIMRNLLDRLLAELRHALTPITALTPEASGFEYNPALAQTAAGSETVMVAKFVLRIGLRETQASVCLPFSSFAQALKSAASPQLSDTDRRKRAQAATAVVERLNHVPVDVGVRFSPITISSQDLLDLAVGDVIPLRHPKDAALEVTTNEVTFAYALRGNHRSRLACQIVPTPTDKDAP